MQTHLVAEELEVSDAIPAEAVLADGVWALVVAPDELERAVALAIEHGHRLPLIGAGHGQPRGALAGATGLDEALAYLAEVDLPAGRPGVSADGVIRGRTWAAWRAPEQPVLGSGARARRLQEAEGRHAALKAQLPQLREAAQTRAAAAAAVRRAAEVSPQIDGLRAGRRAAFRGARRGALRRGKRSPTS